MISFHDLKTIFLAQIPIIGPHSDIEGELLLLGKKPLGWISINLTNDPRLIAERLTSIKWQQITKERDIQRQLDKAVSQGRLYSIDVVQRDYQVGSVLENSVREGWFQPTDFIKYDGSGKPYIENVFRHYCQPRLEDDLKLLAAYNQAYFNRLNPSEQNLPALKRTFGKYLGYRKRDRILWTLLDRSKATIFEPAVKAILKMGPIAKPAYQERMLRTPKKPATSSSPPSSQDRDPA